MFSGPNYRGARDAGEAMARSGPDGLMPACCLDPESPHIDWWLPLHAEEMVRGGTHSVLYPRKGRACARCAGRGLTDGVLCGDCGGWGSIPEPAALEVVVPTRVDEGALLVIPGHGNRAAHRGAGELRLMVLRDPEAASDTADGHLYKEVAISPRDAELGAVVDVDMGAFWVRMELPPGVSDGTQQTVRGAGEDAAHDLHLTVRVDQSLSRQGRSTDDFAVRDVDGVRRLLKEGKAAEARALVNGLLQHWPMDGELHFLAGCASCSLGEAHRAIGSLRRAWRDCGYRSALLHFYLARTYASTGSTALAVWHYELALRIDPAMGRAKEAQTKTLLEAVQGFTAAAQTEEGLNAIRNALKHLQGRFYRLTANALIEASRLEPSLRRLYPLGLQLSLICDLRDRAWGQTIAYLRALWRWCEIEETGSSEGDEDDSDADFVIAIETEILQSMETPDRMAILTMYAEDDRRPRLLEVVDEWLQWIGDDDRFCRSLADHVRLMMSMGSHYQAVAHGDRSGPEAAAIAGTLFWICAVVLERHLPHGTENAFEALHLACINFAIASYCERSRDGTYTRSLVKTLRHLERVSGAILGLDDDPARARFFQDTFQTLSSGAYPVPMARDHALGLGTSGLMSAYGWVYEELRQGAPVIPGEHLIGAEMGGYILTSCRLRQRDPRLGGWDELALPDIESVSQDIRGLRICLNGGGSAEYHSGLSGALKRLVGSPTVCPQELLASVLRLKPWSHLDPKELAKLRPAAPRETLYGAIVQPTVRITTREELAAIEAPPGDERPVLEAAYVEPGVYQLPSGPVEEAATDDELQPLGLDGPALGLASGSADAVEGPTLPPVFPPALPNGGGDPTSVDSGASGEPDGGFCPDCGARAKAGARFCRACGSRLD